MSLSMPLTTKNEDDVTESNPTVQQCNKPRNNVRHAGKQALVNSLLEAKHASGK